jgi:hypothetical protein
VKINGAVHVTLFHVGEGRKQDGRGRGVVLIKNSQGRALFRQRVYGREGRSGNLKKAMAKKVETQHEKI